MTTDANGTADIEIDVEALNKRYEEERTRRLRSDANAQYVRLEGKFANFDHDIYADPNFTRAAVDEQLDVLGTLSKEDPDLMITDMIRFLDDSTGLLQQVLTAWRTGDANAMDRLIREDLDKHEGVYDRFLTRRNAAWVPKIDALIKNGGTYFVVVGAGHLVGDKSVIALLRAKGYEVERY